MCWMLAVWALGGSIATVEVSSETFTLALDDAGRLVSFRDTASGTDYVVPGEAFCRIETPAGALLPERVARAGGDIAFEFTGGARLRYGVETGPDWAVFRLREATGLTEAGATAVRHCALRLIGLGAIADPMNACYGEDWAVALRSAAVNVRGYPVGIEGLTGAVELRVETYPAHGLEPAAFGIVAAPRAGFGGALRAFEEAAGLPSPRPGGEPGKASRAARESYLFITGMRESEVDEVVRWARRGGFATVLIGGDWSRSHGHHEVNTDLYPDGLPSFERACAKLHAAGLRVGLHFLAAAVYLDDPYVTPVPDRRLVVDARGTLASAVTATDTVLPLIDAPDGFASEDGGYMGRGTYVRVGDEIVRYGAPVGAPAPGLARCARGELGTTATAHEAGEPIEHLQRSYGYFLYDLDSSLAEEVVGNVCRVANAVKADMLYFDGSELLQGDHWFYNAKMQDLYWRGLANKDTFLQGSSYSHYSWSLISRMASADGHGDVKGYLDERLPWLDSYAANLMPADIGWYYVYDPNVTADQFDYILQKCLGYGASISVQTNPAQLATHPEMGAIFDLVAAYDRLRLGGEVPEEVRTLLREPGREYRLLRDPLRLRRTQFGEWQSLAELPAELPVDPPGEGARLGLELRCGPLSRPGSAYRGADARALEDFEDLAAWSPVGATSEGVTQELVSVEGEGPEGGRCGRLSATSTRADDGGWSCLWKALPAQLDLSWHRGIGFWLRGDGQGGAFKLQIRDSEHATDYYVTNDFAEWRYIQVERPDRPQPEPVDYSRITQVLLYYNGLPAGKKVTCWVDDIRALPALDAAEVRDPRISLEGREVVIPAVLAQGERLIWRPGEAPSIIPASAGPRRICSPVSDLVLSRPGVVRLSSDSPVSASLEARLVLDLPEEIALP